MIRAFQNGHGRVGGSDSMIQPICRNNKSGSIQCNQRIVMKYSFWCIGRHTRSSLVISDGRRSGIAAQNGTRSATGAGNYQHRKGKVQGYRHGMGHGQQQGRGTSNIEKGKAREEGREKPLLRKRNRGMGMPVCMGHEQCAWDMASVYGTRVVCMEHG